MTRILFVCLGNICRSPLAEAILRREILQRGIQNDFLVESCGTANYHVGDPPDPRTIRNALKNGTEIHHIGRQFDRSDFDRFDIILPMDASNRSNVLRLPEAEKYQHKIKLVRNYDTDDRGADVPDPYTGDEKDFQEVYEMLERSINGLLQSVAPEN